MSEETVKELMRIVNESGVNELTLGEKLDEAVHDAKCDEAAMINNGGSGNGDDDVATDAKSEEASAINNEGFESQLEYLFGSEPLEVANKTLQEMIDEAVADRG
jgi:division protein CdvB (Snf7/Vps24/ESCRT-III family)